MCVGIPMQVQSIDQNRAYCVRFEWVNEFTETHTDGLQSEKSELIDASLVGDINPGDWVLVFINAAREKITENRAHQIGNALKALVAVNAGNLSELDGLFSDLDREPQLPPHLKNQIKK